MCAIIRYIGGQQQKIYLTDFGAANICISIYAKNDRIEVATSKGMYDTFFCLKIFVEEANISTSYFINISILFTN